MGLKLNCGVYAHNTGKLSSVNTAVAMARPAEGIETFMKLLENWCCISAARIKDMSAKNDTAPVVKERCLGKVYTSK